MDSINQFVYIGDILKLPRKKIEQDFIEDKESKTLINRKKHPTFQESMDSINFITSLEDDSNYLIN